MLLKIFLVVYAATGGIGAVSKSLPDMEQCEAAAHGWTDRNARIGESYTFKCEQRKSRPKVQIKIDAEARKLFESDCINLGLPAQCRDLPNGDVEILTTDRDKRGQRKTIVTKAKDLR